MTVTNTTSPQPPIQQFHAKCNIISKIENAKGFEQTVAIIMKKHFFNNFFLSFLDTIIVRRQQITL